MGLPDPAASRAVLIGVDAYDPLPGLPSVEKSVAALAELLTESDLWGLPKEHCVVLSNPRSRVDVLDKVHAAAAEARDAFLVYFAGHGLLSPDTELYLALPDSHAQRLHHAVEYSRLRQMLVTVCRARSKVVVLDCCYSARALEGHLAAPVEFADQTGVDGTYVMTACGETKTALAPPGEKYTAFTGELIKTLSEGIPAGPDPLDMDAIFWQVRRELIAKERPVPQQRARNAGHSIALVRNRWTGARSPEAIAYATALRDAFQPADDQGISRQLLAEAAELPPTMLSRYFQGVSVAPTDFLAGLAHFLAEQGLPLPQPDLDRLDDLRRQAQAADPDPAIRLLHWQEEVQRLKADLTEAARERDAERQQTALHLAELDKRLTDLGQELANAVARAETAERERDESRATVDRRRIRLEHARDYVRQVEEDLTAQKEQTRLLQQEVAVLRGQVRQLLTEEPSSPASEDPGSGELVGAVLTRTDTAAAQGAGPQLGSGRAATRRRPRSAGSTRSTSPQVQPRSCLLAVLLGPLVVYLAITCLISFGETPLKYGTGRKPAAAPVKTTAYVWDVKDRVESTFHPESGGPAGELTGSLSVSVPAGCTDQTVQWQIIIDGEVAGRGTLTGKRDYQLPTAYSLDHTPRGVTLEAGWIGGSTACPAFGLVWKEPELSMKFDIGFAF